MSTFTALKSITQPNPTFISEIPRFPCRKLKIRRFLKEVATLFSQADAHETSNCLTQPNPTFISRFSCRKLEIRRILKDVATLFFQEDAHARTNCYYNCTVRSLLLQKTLNLDTITPDTKDFSLIYTKLIPSLLFKLNKYITMLSRLRRTYLLDYSYVCISQKLLLR